MYRLNFICFLAAGLLAAITAAPVATQETGAVRG